MINLISDENEGHPYMTIDNDPLPDGMRSTLVIREAHDKDFSSYNCSVANEYGMDATEITLKRRSKLNKY